MHYEKSKDISKIYLDYSQFISQNKIPRLDLSFSQFLGFFGYFYEIFGGWKVGG
jgi:hypothetical protein